MLAPRRMAFIVACVASFSVNSAIAQETAPLQQLVRYTVKPDRVDEFLHIQARFTELAKERGRTYRTVWRNRTNREDFAVLAPRENFASYDVGPLQTVETSALGERLRQLYVSREVEIRREIPELTSRERLPHLVVTSTATLHPGKASEFMTLWAGYTAVAKKLGITNFGWVRTAVGGSPLTFMSWRAIENMAELDTPDTRVRDAMGEAAYRDLFQKINALVNIPREIHIWELQEELSFSTEQ